MSWSNHLSLSSLLIIILAIGCKNFNDLNAGFIDDLHQIHRQLENSSGDSARILIQQANAVHNKIQLPDSLKAKTAYHDGMYHFELGKIDTAAQLFHRAISLLEAPIDEEKANYFRMAWRAYSGQGEFGECLAISNRLEALLNNTAHPKRKALLYFIRENAYQGQRNYEKAIENNQLQIEQLELANDTQGLVSALITKVFYTYFVSRNAKGAFEILDTLVNRQASHSADVHRLVFGEYGVYLFYEGRYREALNYYKKGLQMVHQMNDHPGQDDFLGTSWSNIAEAYMELDDYEQAQVFLDSVKLLGLKNLSEPLRNNTLRYQLQLAYRDDQGSTPC